MNECIFPADTKSIIQTHTLCTTQVDKNRQNNILQRRWRMNHRVIDTFIREHSATSLEAEPQGYRYRWRNLFQSGGEEVHVKKTIEHFCGFNWQLWHHKHWNMTSLPVHHMKVISCSLFLDLSKAFDCCDHEILLDKLYHYGIRGVSHKPFSNFLHNRMQCTQIGAFKSSYKRISCGVPQGSVISPLLFLIYINDITKASSFHTTLFADDINLHMSTSSFNVLQTTVNLELCKIDHWLRANKLSLNYNKTNFMLLTSRKHNPASFQVIINNHNISYEMKSNFSSKTLKWNLIALPMTFHPNFWK